MRIFKEEILKKVWLVIVIMIFLVACDKDGAEDAYSFKTDEIPNFDFLQDLNTDLSEEENKYWTFIKGKADIEYDLEILKIEKHPLELQRGTYVFVLLGRPDQMGNTLYILKENPDLEWVGQIYEKGLLDDFDFIKMAGAEKTYLQTYLTNHTNTSGFKVFDIEGNEIKALWKDQVTFESFSATSLVDTDEDGYMDTLTWGAFSYNVLYYPTNKIYLWQEDGFRILEHDVEVGPYPESIDQVVKHFIELHALQEASKDIEGRLKAINPKDVFYDQARISFEDIQSAAILLEDFIDYRITEEETTGLVILEKGSQGKSQPYKISFAMARKDGRWVVDDVE